MDIFIDWSKLATDLTVASIPRIILQLNRKLEADGAIFRLQADISSARIDFVPINTAWLYECGHYTVSVSFAFQEYVQSKFKEHGYLAKFNRELSCFWLEFKGE